jgi:two-component system chemotaxis response regulator CheY
MKKIVLDIGNCNPDHASIVNMLNKYFDVQVLRAHQLSDALAILKRETVDLVLVNRKLDIDYSDGLDIIRYLKQESPWKSLPVMLVTNYAEHQQAAVELGAEYGFGKLETGKPATHERLAKILANPSPS